MKKTILFKKKQSLLTKRIKGTSQRPRIVVTRTNKHLYASLIDDEKGNTLASVNDRDVEKQKSGKITPLEKAKIIGNLIAQKAEKLKIKKAIFDRMKYRYHGQVKNVAEGAREKGLSI